MNWIKKHKIVSGIIGVVAFFIIVGALGSSSTTTKSESTNSTSVKSQSNNAEPTATIENKQPNVPAEYKSALKKATSYATIMHMSKRGVYDQLVSDYGEKFSPEAAQYAIDNVKADWNANALAKAKSYQEQQSMSPAAIQNQLISDYGEKFTQAEADYAIQHLSK